MELILKFCEFIHWNMDGNKLHRIEEIMCVKNLLLVQVAKMKRNVFTSFTRQTIQEAEWKSQIHSLFSAQSSKKGWPITPSIFWFCENRYSRAAMNHSRVYRVHPILNEDAGALVFVYSGERQFFFARRGRNSVSEIFACLRGEARAYRFLTAHDKYTHWEV